MNIENQEPKSFLFTTWEGGGNVAPALTVARKLIQQGHRVRFMCDVSAREEARSRGVEFRAWNEAPNRPDRTAASCPVRDWEAASPPEGIKRMMDNIMMGPALKYARDVLAELDREPTDVVVTSEMLMGVMAACESRGQPFAIFAANLCFLPLPGMPAFGPGLPPPGNPEEDAIHAQIKDGTQQMLDAGLDVLNGARLQLGLQPLLHVCDQIQAAGLYLLGTSRAFDFPVERLPDQIRYVGPQLDEPAWARSWTPPWSQDDRRPLIAVCFSTTFQNHARALQDVIDAAATLPVRTLVTLGILDPTDLRPADNTALVSSAPHDPVMKQAAVVVTHGGHGTVMRALNHKRPVLIMPHGRDQGENAIRITERGAGLCLPTDAGRQQIEDALRRLVEDPAFSEAATRLGDAVDAGTGDFSVVPLLESLATGIKARPCLTG